MPLDTATPQYSFTTDSEAEHLIAIQNLLEQERYPFEQLWREVALRVMPHEEQLFYSTEAGAGKTISDNRLFLSNINKQIYQFDSYATIALDKFASALQSYSMPRAQKWHHLKPFNRALEDNIEAQQYLDIRTDIMFDVRYSTESGMDSAARQAYLSRGLYGHGCIFIEDALAEGIKYIAIHPREAFPIQNRFGMIDGIHRKYELYAFEAMEKFKNAEKIPAKVREDASNPRRKYNRHVFLHVVRKNELYNPRQTNRNTRKYEAIDISVSDKIVLQRGYYDVFPYVFTRHLTMPGSVYSLSPSMLNIADIKTLNEMMKTSIRYGQMVTDPPILLQDLDSLQPFALRPAAMNRGYLDDQGNPTARAFKMEGDPRFAFEIMQQKREAIAIANLNTLFDILVQLPEMTATQAMIRLREKASLIAPITDREQTEFLGPIVRIENYYLERAGAFPEPPQVFLQYGGGVKVEYDSPMTRIMRSEEGVGILRTIETAMQVAGVNPKIIHRVNLDKCIQILAKIENAPFAIFRTDEEVAELEEMEQEQINEQKVASGALTAGQVVKDMSAAGKVAQ